MLDMKSKSLISNDCSAIEYGKFQSPINIKPDCAIEMHDQGEIKLNYDSTFISIEDNGKLIKVKNDDSGSAIINGRNFQLEEFHFHTGSEHAIDCHYYKMELHLVNKSQVGRIAVIGVLFEIGRENSALQTILDNINKKELVTDAIEIDIQQLIPRETTYYHYLGSLTTSGCVENVEWYVFENPIEMSKEQLNIFETRYLCNTRGIQDLNGRTILKKKINLFQR